MANPICVNCDTKLKGHISLNKQLFAKLNVNKFDGVTKKLHGIYFVHGIQIDEENIEAAKEALSDKKLLQSYFTKETKVEEKFLFESESVLFTGKTAFTNDDFRNWRQIIKTTKCDIAKFEFTAKELLSMRLPDNLEDCGCKVQIFMVDTIKFPLEVGAIHNVMFPFIMPATKLVFKNMFSNGVEVFIVVETEKEINYDRLKADPTYAKAINEFTPIDFVVHFVKRDVYDKAKNPSFF